MLAGAFIQFLKESSVTQDYFPEMFPWISPFKSAKNLLVDPQHVIF